MALKLNPVSSTITPQQQTQFAVNVLKKNGQPYGMFTNETNLANANKINQRNSILASAQSTPSVAPASQDAIGGGNISSIAAGGGSFDPAAAAAAAESARVNQIKGDVRGKAAQLLALYDQLFGNLDNTIKAQEGDLEQQYAAQFKKAADQYAKAIPTIQNSYASIGSGDSTDATYAKNDAKQGFEDTNTTIGKNKSDDIAKLGKTKAEKKATYQAGKDSVNSNLGRLDSTTDVNSLESMRGELDKGVSDANIENARLGTDGSFRDALRASTGDNGRFDQAVSSLDSIIKSSMSGGEKAAAATSIATNAGLSEAEKQKLNLQFGNVFNEKNIA